MAFPTSNMPVLLAAATLFSAAATSGAKPAYLD